MERLEDILRTIDGYLERGDVAGVRRCIAERLGTPQPPCVAPCPEQERLRNFERLFETTNLLPAIAGFDGHFKELGPRWMELLGYAEAELKAKPFVGFVHPDDVESTQAAAARLAGGTEVVSFDNRYRRADGSYVVLRWYSSMDVAAERIYAVAINVTEESEARRRIERSERLLNETGSMARVGGWELDLATGQLYWLPQVFEIHELPVRGGEPPLDRAMDFYPGDAKARIAEAVDRCIELHEPYDLELPFVTAKGRHRWVRAMGKPTFGADGQVVGLHGSFQDITETKRREDELTRAREQALEASRFKSQFLANVSHEIRTPLNGMIGTLSLARDLDMGDEVRELVDVAQHSAENLLVIVNDLLDLAKIESGHMSFEHVAFDVTALTQDVVRTFRAQATAKGVELRCAIGSVPSRCSGDPKRVRQVLANLVGNAVKFTPAGHVEVWIGRKGADRMTFEVRDTGVGIPDEIQHRIFEAFRQADGSITRRFGGTGLGLAICRELVCRLGGTIEVESVQGIGSVFRFELPLPSAQEVLGESASPAPACADDHKMEILLAEDNDINALVAQRTLTRMGHEVTRVVNGREAVERALEGDYDLVLMDVQMPGTDGLEATREIRRRADPEALRLPIIALTANAFHADVRRCLEAGMDDHLSKPLRRQALEDVLARFGARSKPPEPRVA